MKTHEGTDEHNTEQELDLRHEEETFTELPTASRQNIADTASYTTYQLTQGQIIPLATYDLARQDLQLQLYGETAVVMVMLGKLKTVTNAQQTGIPSGGGGLFSGPAGSPSGVLTLKNNEELYCYVLSVTGVAFLTVINERWTKPVIA